MRVGLGRCVFVGMERGSDLLAMLRVIDWVGGGQYVNGIAEFLLVWPLESCQKVNN